MSEPPVEIDAPDISAYAGGSAGVPYVAQLDSGRAGPHAVITALVHGNELCGAWALLRLLERGIRPCRGRLSLAFVNTAAFDAFDPANPKASRYLDEDLNRVWSAATLDGPRRSRELERARALRPLIEDADFLLDLHSMQSPSPPLLLTGVTAKGRRLALAMGFLGCVSPTDPLGREDALEDAQQRYTDLVRWGELEKAGTFVDPELRDDFLALAEDYAALRITDFEIQEIHYGEHGKLDASVTVVYKGYLVSTLIERTAPEVARRLCEDGAHAAVLTPA